MINYIKKKIIRLQGSRNVLRLNYLYHKLFGEKNPGSLGLDFSNKPDRQYIIQNIIKKKNFQSYLEIGCFNNDLFDFIKCNKKVGVDPYSGGTIRKTSDDFFYSNKDQFDCIFIDGLHEYKQVKKDILNSLKILKPNGIILLHDCLPNTIYNQAMPRVMYDWNGDVWKAIVECRTNTEIDTYTCYADFGIGVIVNRKNSKKLDIECKNFSKLKFKDYYKNHNEYMNIIEYEELMKII
jgi:hypothetical protein